MLQVRTLSLLYTGRKSAPNRLLRLLPQPPPPPRREGEATLVCTIAIRFLCDDDNQILCVTYVVVFSLEKRSLEKSFPLADCERRERGRIRVGHRAEDFFGASQREREERERREREACV